MADNFIPGLRQANNCLVLRRRELPIKGQTLVKKDELVNAESIVAKAELPGDIQILRIAEAMGIESEDVAAGIIVKTGDSVKEGDVLCEHKGLFGLFRSQFRSPQSGSIDFISEALGHIGLRQPSRILSLNAYCGGKVREVVDGYSVELETNGTVIQGIFGVGGEKLGKIKMLDIQPSQILRKESLPADFKDAILVGGTLPDIEVLNCLAAGGAAGLVVGGIDDVALRQFLGFDLGLAVTGNENIAFSLMVTEGFGNLAISERVLSLFAQHDSAFACMNGSTQIRAGAIRPEVIIPVAAARAHDEGILSQGLQIGSKVRLIRVPYFGVSGEVVGLPSQPEKLEAGTMARILKVKLQDGKVVSVPRANAEIIF